MYTNTFFEGSLNLLGKKKTRLKSMFSVSPNAHIIKQSTSQRCNWSAEYK